MRLEIFGQFVVSVVTPRDGWSKGRPIAIVEEGDRSYPADLLIPNDLTDSELECYVAQTYNAFAQPGEEIRRLDPCGGQIPETTRTPCVKPPRHRVVVRVRW